MIAIIGITMITNYNTSMKNFFKAVSANVNFPLGISYYSIEAYKKKESKYF